MVIQEIMNILLETQKQPAINEIINLLVFSYERFFNELNLYDYINFKKRVDSMIVN